MDIFFVLMAETAQIALLFDVRISQDLNWETVT